MEWKDVKVTDTNSRFTSNDSAKLTY